MHVIKAEPEERPVIQLGPDLKSIVDAAVEALSADDEIFCRGSALVRIVRSGPPKVDGIRRPEGAPVIRAVTLPTLREHLASVARWERWEPRKREFVQCLPSDAVVQAVGARGEWPALRQLVGIAEAPGLLADGTVLQRPGYDEASGYFYIPSEDFPRVPDQPTHAHGLAARDELLECICDFPFATEAHRSAWLALLLTLFARPAIDGCVPLGGVDATTAGSGKSRLVDLTAIIALGREAAKVPQPEDDTGCRKIITALVDEGEVFAVFDNIARPVAYASLVAALTAGVWKDRVLGTNRTISAPMRVTWAVTGNNLEVGGDTARRTLHIRLESRLENPEDRQDFKHVPLLPWVRAERPRLVVAALTLLRAYVVAGRPDQGCKSWGSFESWSRLIAHAVKWVDMPDPQDTRVELVEAVDTAKGALAALMVGWRRLDAEGTGLTAKAAIDALYPLRREDVAPDGFDDLRDAIETLCPPAPGKPPSGTKLGYVLRQAKRRVIGRQMFDFAKGHGGTRRWSVVNALEGG